MKNNWLNLMNLLKKILILTETIYHLKNKNTYIMNLLKKKSSEFTNLEKKINSDNLIYKYKTKGISPKDFSNYQNPIELFKDLRDGNINPKEVLKDQSNFKSDLGEIKKGNPKDQINLTQNIEKLFDLREKIIDFFRDYYFFLSKAKYKGKNMEGSQSINS